MSKKYFSGKLCAIFCAIFCMIILPGCQSDNAEVARLDDFDYTSVVNNHLTLQDFADHLVACGLNVKQVQRLRADVLRAADAMAVLIDDDEIGVYYFNTDLEPQRKILESYAKNGYAYILGFRFPVFMAGSYVLTGVEKHPKKKEIAEALRSFK